MEARRANICRVIDAYEFSNEVIARTMRKSARIPAEGVALHLRIGRSQFAEICTDVSLLNRALLWEYRKLAVRHPVER